MLADIQVRGVVLALSSLGLACANAGPSGIFYATGDDAVTADGLHRIEWEPFKVSYVKPGAELSRYDKLMIDAVTVSYRRPPRDHLNLGNDYRPISPNFRLSAEKIEAMKRTYRDAFVEELSKNPSFAIASEPGSDVLRISGHIVNLVVTTPPLDEQDTDETVSTSSSGSMTLVLEARDSESGEPLVRVREWRPISLTGSIVTFYQSEPVASSGAVERQFRDWAAALRRELEKFQALRALPEPPPS